MLKIVSGGQTGVDRAALDLARAEPGPPREHRMILDPALLRRVGLTPGPQWAG